MKKYLVLFYAFIFSVLIAHAQGPARQQQFNLEKGQAIQGYDPVAYFTQNKAVKGIRNLRHLQMGCCIIFHRLAIKNCS